jgi:CheY-like chemotaxis protein
MDVLLVEDEPLIREAEADALRDAGLVVAEAGTGEEALALLEIAADGASPVIVADLHLGPGMDGLALGQQALRRWPDAGVIYATGHPDHLAGHLLGPRERYIVKPFASAALLHAVRRLAPASVLDWVSLYPYRPTGAEKAARSSGGTDP